MTFTVRVDLNRLPWEEGGGQMTSDTLRLLEVASRHGWVLQFYASVAVARALPELVRACADHGHDVDLLVTSGVSWESASEVWRSLGLVLMGASSRLDGAKFVAPVEPMFALELPLSEEFRDKIGKMVASGRMRTHRQRWRESE